MNVRRCVRCQATLRRTNDGNLCSPCARIAQQSGPELPVDFYGDPAVVAALADYEFGRFFKIVRADLRLTQEQFGHLVGLAQSRVCKIENGVRLRDIESVARVASVLDTPPSLLGFAADERVAARGHWLVVAIAVVLTDSDVLMVRRRESDPSGIAWQFPAGIVKPGESADSVAVRETLTETGVHCAVRSPLGSRVHPVSGVECDYFLCDYLAGSVENRDVLENVDALWVPKHDVTRLVPADRIFEPIMRTLATARSVVAPPPDAGTVAK